MMYSDSLNPFGLLDGRLVTINDVSSGLACGCLCPACKQPLVARKGNQKVHHFAHAIKTDCKGALETALHIKAKAVLDNHRLLNLPRNWKKDRFLEYSEAFIETKIGNIRPDVVLSTEKGPFLVEIYVSHRTGIEKISYIKKLDLPCIEVDLRYLKRLDLLDDKLVENAVIHAEHTKRWLHRPDEFFWPEEMYHNHWSVSFSPRPLAVWEPYFAGFSRRAKQKYGS